MVKHLTQSKDVIWRRIGDDIVIIREGELFSHVLNKTAAIIWEMCDGTSGVDEITARLCERFEVSYDEAHADVDTTVKTLTKANVLKYN
jgi:Coenzyme PQQ synthesis protein D (PqqD)